MKRLSTLLFALLVAIGLKAAPPDTVLPKEKQSLLWKISGRGLRKPSFLFGTIHMLCPQDFVWTTVMRRSLQQCTQVCFEMDMDDPKVLMEIGMGMVDQSGNSLQDYFTPEQYQIISRYIADSLRMNIAMFEQMKPAALLSLFASKAMSCPNPISYESKIQEEARKGKKEIVGLEEAAEQIALLNSIPVDSIASELVEMAESRNFSTDYQKMVQAYKKQDLSELHRLIEQAKANGDNTYVFLDERNIKWIERIEERIEQQAVFFAVGAGHLWGDNGLIMLLRSSGYTVEAVR